jgi:carbamoyltransferase
MVLTVKARRKALGLVPAVIHVDGTSRIQIVRKESDPLCYAILKALGRRLGVEAAVNTSLNIGTPIVQSPEQAIEALRRSRGLAGLVLVSEEGTAHLVRRDFNKTGKSADIG